LTSHELGFLDIGGDTTIHIQKVLNYTNGNKTKTAELLNIALTTLYRKLNEYGLD
jgi:two-component system NtrC family response regulator